MFKSSWKPHLIPTALLAFTTLAAIALFSVVAFSRTFLTIERGAEQIYDVAMPQVFDAQRQVRVLERLASGGRALTRIESAADRRQWRQQLQSIADDGVLQGDSETRRVVALAFSTIDTNLSELDQGKASAREAAKQRWAPVEFELSDRAEAIIAASSTSASSDVDSILTAVNATRKQGAAALAVLGFSLAIGLGCFLWLVVEPVTRLTRALLLAREGYQLSGGSQRLHEMQLLDDAAVALAQAHRELEATRVGLENEANSDALTGLPNRRRLEYVAKLETARARRYGRPLSVVTLDLDHFKQVNDQYGHHNGDLVLKSVADFLKRTCRIQDLPVRLGGEEFAVLLPETDVCAAGQMGERLRKGVEGLTLRLQDGETINTTISLGAAQLIEDDIDIYTTLQRADRSLYRAKQDGRNRVEIDTPPPPATATPETPP